MKYLFCSCSRIPKNQNFDYAHKDSFAIHLAFIDLIFAANLCQLRHLSEVNFDQKQIVPKQSFSQAHFWQCNIT
jgi:hypothetical protein